METMAGVCGVHGFLDELFHVGWVRIAMGAKNPSSSRDLGRFEGAEGDMGTNSIKLHLVVGGKNLII